MMWWPTLGDFAYQSSVVEFLYDYWKDPEGFLQREWAQLIWFPIPAYAMYKRGVLMIREELVNSKWSFWKHEKHLSFMKSRILFTWQLDLPNLGNQCHKRIEIMLKCTGGHGHGHGPGSGQAMVCPTQPYNYNEGLGPNFFFKNIGPGLVLVNLYQVRAGLWILKNNKFEI